MAAFPLAGNPLCKVEMEYHGKPGHNIGRIHHISLMRRIDICYIDFHMATQNVEPTLTGFKGLNICIKYLDSQPHKPIFYPSNYYDVSNVIRLTWNHRWLLLGNYPYFQKIW